MVALGEVTASFKGRPVLGKHNDVAIYHPAAFCIAQIAVDLPVLLFQVIQSGIVYYWMVGLSATAAAFFTYLLLNFSSAMAMPSFFRAIGAAFPTFDAATRVSGLSIVALFVYTGYLVIKLEMHPWLVWIYWIDPMAYTFEGLIGNELHDTTIPCVGPNLINNGPGYTNEVGEQSCAGVVGAPPGATSLIGEGYLAGRSYSYSHVYRNVGIVWAWWALFLVLTILFTTGWKLPTDLGQQLLIPREKQNKSMHLIAPVLENGRAEVKAGADSEASTIEADDLPSNKSVSTWRNLTYTVQTPDGDRVLLENVQGCQACLGPSWAPLAPGRQRCSMFSHDERPLVLFRGQFWSKASPFPCRSFTRLDTSSSKTFTSP